MDYQESFGCLWQLRKLVKASAKLMSRSLLASDLEQRSQGVQFHTCHGFTTHMDVVLRGQSHTVLLRRQVFSWGAPLPEAPGGLPQSRKTSGSQIYPESGP